MDAVKFINETIRMCNFYRGEDSKCCSNKSCMFCNLNAEDAAKKAVAIVEQWSAEHPQKTMLQDFLEKFPNATFRCCVLFPQIHQNAVEHGWWDEPRTFGEIIALCHSELSEALEEYRSGRPNLYFPCNAGGLCVDDRPDENVSCGSRIYNPDDPEAPCKAKSKKPEGIAVEMADCIIRFTKKYTFM